MADTLDSLMTDIDLLLAQHDAGVKQRIANIPQAVADRQAEVARMQDSVTNYQAALTAMQTQLATLADNEKAAAEALHAQIKATLQGKITALAALENVAPFKGTTMATTIKYDVGTYQQRLADRDLWVQIADAEPTA